MICRKCKSNCKGHSPKGLCGSCSQKTRWKVRGLSNRYGAVHQWIRRNWGQATRCDKCSIKKRKKYHWSNKGIMDRRKKNWWQLCVPCHLKYDKNPSVTGRIWNKGKKAKDYPKLQAALIKAWAGARGKPAWNRSRKLVPCTRCRKEIMRRPCELKKKPFCTHECFNNWQREERRKLLEEGIIKENV